MHKYIHIRVKYLYGVGFEPTRLSPTDLKSVPLDHSGNHTDISLIIIYTLSL